MKKFGFYALGYKGYECLKAFVSEFGTDHVSFVVSARDKNVKEDYYQAIERFCSDNGIVFSDRINPVKRSAILKFAIGWRWIISEDDNLVVFHDSLLPKYRGFAPLVNALINGEREIGVTALKAESEYDSGDLISQKSISVEYPKKIEDAISDVSELYVDILLEVCQTVISGKMLNYYVQDQSRASYSPWRNDLDYKVNWDRSSQYISRFICAVGYPYKGTETTINGKRVRILDSEVVEDVDVEDRSQHIGKIIFMNSGLPTIICGEGLLKLINIVDEQGASLVGKIPFRSRLGS